jgi:cytochrome c553
MSEAPQQNRVRNTVLFALGLGGVLAIFAVLSLQDPPVNMPSNPVHRLRFNTQGDLMGLDGADVEAAIASGIRPEKKAMEAQVNVSCMACHGPAAEPTPVGHACQPQNICVPTKHPPKNECIKCHRMPAQAPNPSP